MICLGELGDARRRLQRSRGLRSEVVVHNVDHLCTPTSKITHNPRLQEKLTLRELDGGADHDSKDRVREGVVVVAQRSEARRVVFGGLAAREDPGQGSDDASDGELSKRLIFRHGRICAKRTPEPRADPDLIWPRSSWMWLRAFCAKGTALYTSKSRNKNLIRGRS